MPAHQTAEEFARANGFPSYAWLLAASRRIAFHDGYEHFLAIRRDGRELEWNEDDMRVIEPDRSRTGSLVRQPGFREA